MKDYRTEKAFYLIEEDAKMNSSKLNPFNSFKYSKIIKVGANSDYHIYSVKIKDSLALLGVKLKRIGDNYNNFKLDVGFTIITETTELEEKELINELNNVISAYKYDIKKYIQFDIDSEVDTEHCDPSDRAGLIEYLELRLKIMDC